MKTFLLRGLCSIFLQCVAISIAAQNTSPAPTPLSSDIFVVGVKTRKGELKFGEPKKFTDYTGYNNQPTFLPDGRSILFTSIRDKQADIYRYDIRTGATNQITNTPESEFSPTS